MSLVTILATIAYVLLNLYFLAMLARLVLELVRSFQRQWRPRGLGLVLAEGVYLVTDPPIKLVRRVVPPLRIGTVAIDLAWTLVMIACMILISVVSAFL